MPNCGVTRDLLQPNHPVASCLRTSQVFSNADAVGPYARGRIGCFTLYNQHMVHGLQTDIHFVRPRLYRQRSWIYIWLACAALLIAGGCGSSAPVVTESSAPIAVTPQRGWDDAVLYFVILDRFADGDKSNNYKYQPDNPGGFHGGDLRGLTAQLDEIAGLGATAIWITPIQKQIDYAPWAQGSAETGTGSFEHHGFHGYWIDDFRAIEPNFGPG